MTVLWGFSEGHHDATLAVIKDGVLVHNSRAEDYSGIKRDGWLHPNQIQEALSHGKPDRKYFYENPFRTNWRRLKEGRSTIWPSMMATLGNHHLSHAAAAYYTSDLKKSLIIVADAVGELESLVVYRAENNYISDPVFTLRYPNSLGLFYSNVTAKCGLKANDEEYILTYMSSKGTKIRQELYDELDIDGIRYKAKVNHNLKPDRVYHGDDRYDAAFTAQRILEDYITNVAIYYRTYYGIHNMVFTGGVAHNTLVKKRLERMFDRVVVPKDPGDGGSALGAILQHTKQHIYA